MKEVVDLTGLNDLQRKLKKKFPVLTNADLEMTQNSEKAMLQVIAYKLRKTKNEMISIILFL